MLFSFTISDILHFFNSSCTRVEKVDIIKLSDGVLALLILVVIRVLK